MTTRFKILVTLDGSELSHSVLASIKTLHRPEDTELILIQVIDPVTYTPYVTPMAPGMSWDPQIIEHDWVDHRKAVVDEMNTLAAELQSLGYSVSVRIPVGDPVNEIVEHAQEENVNMIAMATHGRTGILRLLLGSVAEGVLRHSNIPVYLIRPDNVSSPAGKEKSMEANDAAPAH